jgi:uracil phosphoribosyltransferase
MDQETAKAHSMVGLTVINHPLVEHKMTLIRDRNTPTAVFRRLLREISMLMAYEALRDLELENVAIDTPVCPMVARKLAGKKLCFVSVLRAGDGLLQGLLELVPSARVGHIGLYRDPATLMPVTYYCKLPEDIGARTVIVVDPMLATGGSATAAIELLKQWGVPTIKLLSIIAAPEGIRAVEAAFPDTQIFICTVDEQLNAQKFIVPGLGDAGDRIFNT